MGHEASLEESARRRRREPRVCRERAGDELTEALVRDAEHTCARNTLEGVQHGFDLGRIDVLAAGDDPLAGASEDEQVAVLVEAAEVVRYQEAVRVEGRFAVQVAGAERRAT